MKQCRTQDTAEEGYPMPLEIPPEDEEDDDEELTEEERRERDEVVPFLLKHAYHLPHHNLYQDWWQYMTNNHPVFGICLHHKYHPLSWKVRAISLVGSMLLGLALTNMVYLAFVFVDQDSEQALIDGNLYGLVNNNGNGTSVTGNAQVDQAVNSVSVTTGNLVLWLVGAPVHGFYDSIAWALMGCGCCHFHKHDSWWARLCRTSGAFVVTFGVIAIACLASFASLLRAAVKADEDIEITVPLNMTNITVPLNMTNISVPLNTTNISVPLNMTNMADTTTTNYTGVSTNLTEFDDAIDFSEMDSSSDPNIGAIVHDELLTLVQERDFANYQFVVSFLVELLLSYIIFYPLVGTLFFSGVLSCCGRYPLFHGRQYEIEQLKLARFAAEEEANMEPGVEVEFGPGHAGMEQSLEQPLVEKEPQGKSTTKSNKSTTETAPLVSREQYTKSTKETRERMGERNRELKTGKGESTKSLKKSTIQGESTKSLKKSTPRGHSTREMEKPTSSTKADKPGLTKEGSKKAVLKSTATETRRKSASETSRKSPTNKYVHRKTKPPEPKN